MPHGFSQFPVESGGSGVGVGATRTPPIDSLGFNDMEMQTPIAPLPDVANFAVNVDSVDVELPLVHGFGPLAIFWYT